MTVSILAQPTTAQTVSRHVVHTDKLSAEARDYLRQAVTRPLLAAGTSSRDAALHANAWAAGYRSFAAGSKRHELSGAALEGWEYAKGEDAWLLCMIVDAAQDSAAAANYPSVNWG